RTFVRERLCGLLERTSFRRHGLNAPLELCAFSFHSGERGLKLCASLLVFRLCPGERCAFRLQRLQGRLQFSPLLLELCRCLPDALHFIALAGELGGKSRDLLL